MDAVCNPEYPEQKSGQAKGCRHVPNACSKSAHRTWTMNIKTVYLSNNYQNYQHIRKLTPARILQGVHQSDPNLILRRMCTWHNAECLQHTHRACSPQEYTALVIAKTIKPQACHSKTYGGVCTPWLRETCHPCCRRAGSFGCLCFNGVRQQRISSYCNKAKQSYMEHPSNMLISHSCVKLPEGRLLQIHLSQPWPGSGFRPARSLKEVKLPPLVHPETLLAAAKRCLALRETSWSQSFW